jgi:quercetin dioxygenase-like cupin family protein
MKLIRNGSQPSVAGPASFFTGSVRIDAPFKGEGEARVSGATVTFEPGARSNWHTHPLGQTLIVTSGVGWTQCEGEARVEIRSGDIVFCPAAHRHWHGATSTTSMTHIAIAEMLDGRAVDWMEPVSDETYLAAEVGL